MASLYQQLSTPALDVVMMALGGAEGQARLVGGCVRDIILGRHADDIDIASIHPPEMAKQLLAHAKIHTVDTGLAHGTITAVIGKENFQVTTLRQDTACDGRHAQVEYTDDWQLDALRRDFTMNALSMDMRGEIYDYAGGVADAKAGIVRFVGDAEARIAEDYLRILRMFRFHAWVGKGEMLPSQLAACRALAGGMAQLSAERTTHEIRKLLSAPNPYSTLASMWQAQCLQPFLPECEGLEHAEKLEGIERMCALPVRWLRRLLALVGALPDHDLETLAKRWKLSNAERDGLRQRAHAIQNTNAERWQPLIRRYGKEVGIDALVLRGILTAKMADDINAWNIPEFPLSGADVMQCGILSGVQVGVWLRHLEQLWEAGDYQLTKDELISKINTNSPPV